MEEIHSSIRAMLASSAHDPQQISLKIITFRFGWSMSHPIANCRQWFGVEIIFARSWV